MSGSRFWELYAADQTLKLVQITAYLLHLIKDPEWAGITKQY